MTESFDLQPIALPTGVTLNVAVAGDPAHPPIIMLHGFPESHRTWRHIIPDLARDHFVLAPDQRGFAGSSKPDGVENYAPEKMVGDLMALADHFGIGQFTMVGHDWGGAIAWMAALQRPERAHKLVIVNAPHPFLFQKAILDDPAQRAASQYFRAFRTPGFEQSVEAMGLSNFFDGMFDRLTDLSRMGDEKSVYLAQWGQPGTLTGMFNWYRASPIIVPAMDEPAPQLDFLDAPFPPLTIPSLVVWGLTDTALVPSQLDGLPALAPGVRIERVDAGHFVTWENPAAVIAAMRDWGA